jgi:hypothetical protein
VALEPEALPALLARLVLLRHAVHRQLRRLGHRPVRLGRRLVHRRRHGHHRRHGRHRQQALEAEEVEA